MTEMDFDTKFLMNMLSNVLGGINGTVLAACTSKRNLEVGESTVKPPLDVKIDEGKDVGEELKNFSVSFQKIYDGLIETSQLFVLGIASGVVAAATVKNVTATIAGGVFGDSFFIGEGKDANN